MYEVPTTDKNTSYGITIDKLKQYTQYAYYVGTQAVNRENEAFVMNVTQGLSDVNYFEMPPDIPTAPKVETISKTHNTITVEWYPQVPDPELITYYSVDIFVQPDDHQLLEARNFCEHPRVESASVPKQVKIHHSSANRKCTLWEIATEMSLNRVNITAAERADAIHQRKVDCLLVRERNIYQQLVATYLEDHVNSDCEPDDTACENEYNSFRFKRDLDNLVEYDGNVSDWSDYSSIFSNHIGNMTFLKDEKNGTIDNLKPFTLYTMHFFSCNNVTNCSAYYLHNERTAELPEADNITFAVKMDDAGNSVHLDFNEPENPNGLTVAFVIEHRDFANAKITETCLTRKQHYFNKNR